MLTILTTLTTTPTIVIVALTVKSSFASLVEISPTLLISIGLSSCLLLAGSSTSSISSSSELSLIRSTVTSSSSSPVAVLLLLPPLASPLDVLHHLLTLLVPPLLLLIHPKPNPTLLLELVIEVVLRLLRGAGTRLLGAWNLISPVGVCSCLWSWGWKIHIVLFLALQLLVVIKVIVFVRPVVAIVKVVHALQLLSVNDRRPVVRVCQDLRSASGLPLVSWSDTISSPWVPSSRILSSGRGSSGQLQRLHEARHDRLVLIGGWRPLRCLWWHRLVGLNLRCPRVLPSLGLGATRNFSALAPVGEGLRSETWSRAVCWVHWLLMCLLSPSVIPLAIWAHHPRGNLSRSQAGELLPKQWRFLMEKCGLSGPCLPTSCHCARP